MTAPKVELKCIKYHEGMEGQGFNADLWINGVNCMHVRDNGNGGEMDSHDNTYNNPKADIVRANIKLLDEYIAALPDYVFPAREGQRELRIKIDLAIFVEELLNKITEEKNKKKLLKLQIDHIIWGKPNGSSYMTMKLSKPLSEYDPTVFAGFIKMAKEKHFKAGDVFLNTNFVDIKINTSF